MDSKPYVLVICAQFEWTEIRESLRAVSDLVAEYVPGGRFKAAIPPEKYNNATHLITVTSVPPSKADAPKLKYIHSLNAGVDEIIKSAFYQEAHASVRVTTSSGIHGPQIGEWVFMTLFSFNHGFGRLLEQQKERKWLREAQMVTTGTTDVAGQKIGIIGYGGIGRQIGRLADASGMEVVVYTYSDRSTPESRRQDRMRTYTVPGTGDQDGTIPSAWFSGKTRADLQTFLKQEGAAPLDVVVLALPLTTETDNLIGKGEIDVLAKGKTFLINVSRGGMVNEEALVDALESGQLRGAALDVTAQEPLPAESPLWTARNCIITPHISGATTRYWKRSSEIFTTNLRRLLEEGDEKGRAVLINEVDPSRGY